MAKNRWRSKAGSVRSLLALGHLGIFAVCIAMQEAVASSRTHKSSTAAAFVSSDYVWAEEAPSRRDVDAWIRKSAPPFRPDGWKRIVRPLAPSRSSKARSKSDSRRLYWQGRLDDRCTWMPPEHRPRPPRMIPAPHPMRTDVYEWKVRWRHRRERTAFGNEGLYLEFRPDGRVRSVRIPDDLKDSEDVASFISTTNQTMMEELESKTKTVSRIRTALANVMISARSQSQLEECGAKSEDSIKTTASGTWYDTPWGIEFDLYDADPEDPRIVIQWRGTAELQWNPFGSQPKLTRGQLVRHTTIYESVEPASLDEDALYEFYRTLRYRPREAKIRPVVGTFTGAGCGRDMTDWSFVSKQRGVGISITE